MVRKHRLAKARRIASMRDYRREWSAAFLGGLDDVQLASHLFGGDREAAAAFYAEHATEVEANCSPGERSELWWFAVSQEARQPGPQEVQLLRMGLLDDDEPAAVADRLLSYDTLTDAERERIERLTLQRRP